MRGTAAPFASGNSHQDEVICFADTIHSIDNIGKNGLFYQFNNKLVISRQ